MSIALRYFTLQVFLALFFGTLRKKRGFFQ